MAALGRTSADAAQALALDANALNALRRQARDAPDQALSKAAAQFEALFLQMVLKQMRESLPKDGPLDSDTMRTYTSLFDQQVAQQLSSRGIGLREAIVRQLGKRIAAPGAGEAAPPEPAPKATPLPAHPARAAAPAPSSVASSVQAFVDKVKPHAEAAAASLGIPAQLLIAQAGLETGWGRHQPRTADGAVSHNLFGVKAGKGWDGASVAARTTEYVHSVATQTVEKFRAYGSYTAAFRDVAKLLSGNRYAQAVANAADPAAYAKSLQRAGYATDPQYADKLTRAIALVTRHLAAGPADSAVRLVQASGAQESPAAADKRDVPLPRSAG
jgi:flagellar protein FlgJ